MNIALIAMGLLCVVAAAAIFVLFNALEGERARSDELEAENERLRARLPVPAKPLYETAGK